MPIAMLINAQMYIYKVVVNICHTCKRFAAIVNVTIIITNIHHISSIEPKEAAHNTLIIYAEYHRIK